MRSRRVSRRAGRAPRFTRGQPQKDYQRRPPRLESSWSACGGASRDRPARSSVGGCEPRSSRTASRTATWTDLVAAGRYRLLDQVGSGGMGSVWRAYDLRTGRHVALKVLGRHSSTLLARFVREQAVRVRHPHVVAPHGWAAEDDLVVLAMELVRRRVGGRPAARARPARRRHLSPCWSSSCCWAWRPSTAPGSCTATSSPPTSSSRRRGRAAPPAPRRLRGGRPGRRPPLHHGARRDRHRRLHGARAGAGCTAGADPGPLRGRSGGARARHRSAAGPPGRRPLAPAAPARRAAAGPRSRAAHRDGRGGAATAPPAAGPAAGGATGARPAGPAPAWTAYVLAGSGVGRRLARLGRGRWPARRGRRVSVGAPRLDAHEHLTSTPSRIGAHVDQTDPIAEALARETSLVQFFLGDPQGYKGPEIRFAGGAEALRAAPRRPGSTSTSTPPTSSTSPRPTTASGSRAASCSSSTWTPRRRSGRRA